MAGLRWGSAAARLGRGRALACKLGGCIDALQKQKIMTIAGGLRYTLDMDGSQTQFDKHRREPGEKGGLSSTGASDAPVEAPVFDLLLPEGHRLPLICASPHSGRDYPAEILTESRLALPELRRSEDCFVDEIFAAAPRLGVPLLKALFPRVFVDVNREPFEFDPEMFQGALPDFVNTASPRVRAGLGTIARIVANGEAIYPDTYRLDFAVAEQRIRRYYDPYHRALADLITRTQDRFGYCLVLDCHSMPSPGGNGLKGPDFVLGDCHGISCASKVTRCVELYLRRRGYDVVRNTPYAGGYTTRNYGKPRQGVHVLQLEICRSLYMDERNLTPTAGLARMAERMQGLIEVMGRLESVGLLPKR